MNSNFFVYFSLTPFLMDEASLYSQSFPLKLHHDSKFFLKTNDACHLGLLIVSSIRRLVLGSQIRGDMFYYINALWGSWGAINAGTN